MKRGIFALLLQIREMHGSLPGLFFAFAVMLHGYYTELETQDVLHFELNLYSKNPSFRHCLDAHVFVSIHMY